MGKLKEIIIEKGAGLIAKRKTKKKSYCGFGYRRRFKKGNEISFKKNKFTKIYE